MRDHVYLLAFLFATLVCSQIPSTCSELIAMASPTPPHVHCNSPGHVDKPQPLGKTVRVSLATCRNNCLGSTRCISFSHDRSSQACTLYSKRIDAMAFTANSGSLSFSNRRCYTGCPPYTCKQDSCLAAIAGNPEASAQCSSALVVTSTSTIKDTTTQTASTDVQSIVTVYNNTVIVQHPTTSSMPGAEAAIRKAAPTMPSGCLGRAQLSSACSCIGVTATTTTTSTTVITTAFTTQTSTVVTTTDEPFYSTCTTDAASPTFSVQISSSGLGAGDYGYVTVPGSDFGQLSASNNINYTSLLALDSCNELILSAPGLFYDSWVANTITYPSYPQTIYFNDPSADSYYGSTALTCNISGSDMLSCVVGSYDAFFIESNAFNIGTRNDTDPTEITVQVLYANSP